MKSTKKEVKAMTLYDRMKQEIAAEWGIELGAKASAYDNGRIGGEITKRLIAKAKEVMTD